MLSYIHVYTCIYNVYTDKIQSKEKTSFKKEKKQASLSTLLPKSSPQLQHYTIISLFLRFDLASYLTHLKQTLEGVILPLTLLATCLLATMRRMPTEIKQLHFV